MSDYRVQFEVFEGPLDLLLHLVKKQEVDIYQVNLTQIANEFIEYLNQMRNLDLEVAGEFVVMAATLIYIKSRELLPKDQQVAAPEEEQDTDDPRFELIRRLVEYKKFKDAAAQLQVREVEQENIYSRRPGRIDLEEPEAPAARTPASLFDLVNAVSTILKRYGSREDVREIHADPWTVSEKIEEVRNWISTRERFKFSELFGAARNRVEVVCTFLAVLELTRMKQIICVQLEEFGEIEVQRAPEPAPAPPAGSTDLPAGAEAAGTSASGDVPSEAPSETPPEPQLPL